jgi:23S rRNA pseudouridine2605 synthase
MALRRRKPSKGVARKVADDTGLVRLQKVLAAAGIGSRRQCEEIIRQGRVDVDGKTISELGTRVDPFECQIRVDGETVSRPKRKLYFLINKPIGILSTNQDPSGRPRVIDLAPSNERLFTVGRLDKSSEGLILATNDGQLTDLLTHPRYGVEKSYWALVAGHVTPEAVAKLERGVHLAEGFAHAKRVIIKRAHKLSTILEIVLDEGRNREVRRLLARIGHKVLKLRRIAIGPLRLGNLKPGESRTLLREEVEALYEAARQRRRQSGKATKKPTTRIQAAASSPGAIQPLIDHSLPPDEMNDLDKISIGDAIDDEMSDDDSGNELAFEGLSDGSTFIGGPNQEPATAAVDLSPIVPGNSTRRPNRTVIGSEGPRGRKQIRNSRPPGRAGDKTRGRAGGRKRGRP